jgi:hypothetical protein
MHILWNLLNIFLTKIQFKLEFVYSFYAPKLTMTQFGLHARTFVSPGQMFWYFYTMFFLSQCTCQYRILLLFHIWFFSYAPVYLSWKQGQQVLRLKTWHNSKERNCIGGVMVGMLASSAVDRGFEPRWGKTKEYKIGMCCFSAKQAALRRKSKDWLAWKQNNVSEWNDMSSCRLMFQWASTIKIQFNVLV